MKELYPTPKTYDELEAQRKKQELLREKKRVTYPSVKISLFGAVFAVGLTYFLSFFERLWAGASIAGVSWSFCCMILLLAGFSLWCRYVSGIFYYTDKSAVAFVCIYGFLTLLFITITGLLAQMHSTHVVTLLLCVGVASFCASYFILRYVFKVYR